MEHINTLCEQNVVFLCYSTWNIREMQHCVFR